MWPRMFIYDGIQQINSDNAVTLVLNIQNKVVCHNMHAFSKARQLMLRKIATIASIIANKV